MNLTSSETNASQLTVSPDRRHNFLLNVIRIDVVTSLNIMMLTVLTKLLVFLLSIITIGGFVAPPLIPGSVQSRRSSTSSIVLATAPAATDAVQILPDAAAVGAAVREIVERAADAAIAERGHFALAIPGGSILKMLVGSGSSAAWTSQTTLAYVNHKCVPMDDVDLATHAKASKLFLSEWTGCNVILMDGTDDGPAEAASYEAKMKALSADILPRNADGWPIFDLALIGVGDDGHIGSLYPNREEVLRADAWVLPVAMKEPPSITLSLPVMLAAKEVVVAACGVSDKYPQGKSEGMRRAIVEPSETPQTFPASALRPVATWVLDTAAASKLQE
jgi:6-phosphogluconolactonase